MSQAQKPMLERPPVSLDQLKKRSRPQDFDIPLSPQIPKNSTNANTIRIPEGLSAKEAKKFRKDERRKARKEGRDETQIKFIDPGDEILPASKKRKREFPRINEILDKERQEKAKKEETQARDKADDALPQEYKDRYLAIDCEMVGIGTDGKITALARGSITKWNGDIVLDTFVKVPGRVTDFRTWVSGVEAKHLKSKDAMDVGECRKMVAKILKGKILVGHALKNDLNALMLNHPKADIRDTSKYRPLQRLGGKKWRARKLKDIVKEFVGISIQEEGEAHDSVDDARATMELFKRVREAWERELESKKRRH